MGCLSFIVIVACFVYAINCCFALVGGWCLTLFWCDVVLVFGYCELVVVVACCCGLRWWMCLIFWWLV